MLSALRSIAAFAFVSAIVVLSVPGCSQQGEGQHCDSVANGDADCDDGLVCIKQNALLDGVADICCHEDPANDSELRCRRSGTATPVGGSGGTSSAGSSAGGAAGEESVGGTAGAEAVGGAPGASGSPTVTDGGMSGGVGGAPPVPTGAGAAGAAGAATAGQGGAG